MARLPIYEVEPAETTAFFAAAKAASIEHVGWAPADGALPALYLGHGAPPLIDDPLWSSELLSWSLEMPKPAGIVVVSAHWEDAPLTITATSAGTPLFYDFWGFPPRYSAVEYSTPDSEALAKRVVGAMPDGVRVHRHADRGLDHGAYVPLQVMYPLADVPVVQLSMPTHDPARLMAIGARLRQLRHEGVLVVGSGFMTHHGSMSVDQHAILSFNVEFDAWVADALARGDVDDLAGWVEKAPGATIAHPTPDHFLPLFVTLGAAEDVTAVETKITGGLFGNSKRSIQVA